MLNKEQISSVASLHSALANQSIRTKRDATDAQKSAVALLAYFKALPSPDECVATLEQLVAAVATCGMIDKEIDKETITTSFRVAQGLTIKTENGIAKNQLRLVAYVHPLPSVDVVKVHEKMTKNPQAFEKLVAQFVRECSK